MHKMVCEAPLSPICKKKTGYHTDCGHLFTCYMHQDCATA